MRPTRAHASDGRASIFSDEDEDGEAGANAGSPASQPARGEMHQRASVWGSLSPAAGGPRVDGIFGSYGEAARDGRQLAGSLPYASVSRIQHGSTSNSGHDGPITTGITASGFPTAASDDGGIYRGF